jgi:hypothetical protein
MFGKRWLLGCIGLCCLGCSAESTPSGPGAGGAPAGAGGLASGQSAAGTGGAPAGAGGTNGVSSPSAATTAEECVYRGGGGGADAVSCDYVRVEFNEPLPTAGLEVQVTTSSGDVLVPNLEGSPALVVTKSPDQAQALGFALRMVAGNDYAPDWVDVLVRSGEATAAQVRLPLKYSCVALTSDDWCWRADTEILEVNP